MATISDAIGAPQGLGDESLIVGGVSVKHYAATYRDVEFFLGNEPDHASSGDVELALGEVGPGASITRARVRVSGEAYRGKVRDFRGARVTPSPLAYDANGAAAPAVPGQRAFVIDFGGVRTLLGMSVPRSKARIVLVLPWMGTDFGSRPAYPVTGSLAFYAFPEPDPAGKASVGFPAIETAKLFVQIAGSGIVDAGEFAEETRIVTGVMPTNIRASVNGRPVFFTRANVLDREAELEGLAEELDAIAAEARTTVPAMLKIATDTPGALLVTYSAADDLEIERSAVARWGGRDELDAPLAGLTPTPLQLVFPSHDPMPWNVRRIALELRGRFPPWRAFGPVGMPAAKLGVKASAQFSVARRFPLPGPTVLHGIALPLRLAAGITEVRLEIAADGGGAPVEGKPLATVDLVLDVLAAGVAWYEALVAAPFDTGDATALWAVVKGKSGTAEWIAQSEPAPVPPATLYTNEGGAWQRYSARGGQTPAPLMRVLREPIARENAPLLTLALAAGQTGTIVRSADPSEDASVLLEFVVPAGGLTAIPGDGGVSIAATATAAATGVLVVRSATAYFRA